MVYSVILKSQLEGALRMDAEYYQPEYLENVKKIIKYGFNELQQISTIDITKGETPLWRGDGYLRVGIPFLRSENLIPTGLDLSKLVFISEKVNERMKRSKIYPNDILMAIVGATIGQVGLVSDDYSIYNSNQAIAIIRPPKENIARYLSVVLETRSCQLQIERLKGGGARDNLDLHEVKVIKIPKPKIEVLDYCNKVVGGIKKLNRESQLLYLEAESLLLKEVGLEDFINNQSLFSVANLSDVEKANRIDAEYFLSDFSRLIKKIKTEKLGDLAILKKGIEPGSEAYQDSGKLFIRVSSLSTEGIIDKDQKYLNNELYQKLKKDFEPRVGEILLTKDATPGIAYVLKEPTEGMISSGIVRLIMKENINSEYLAFCINSIIGKSQVERDAGGSIIKHWRPEQIKNMQIPILPKVTQEKIADLVVKSHQARKKAKDLLEEAKSKVEKLIESQ